MHTEPCSLPTRRVTDPMNDLTLTPENLTMIANVYFRLSPSSCSGDSSGIN